MPQIFKGLTTVTVWGLFVGGWLAAALNFIIGGCIAGYAFGAAPAPMAYYISYFVAVAFAFAGGFMMLVRKKLE